MENVKEARPSCSGCHCCVLGASKTENTAPLLAWRCEAIPGKPVVPEATAHLRVLPGCPLYPAQRQHQAEDDWPEWYFARTACLLARGRPEDDVAFASMIRGMMVLLKYSVSIAYLFGVSHEHVRRWLKGENLPHPAMRKHVVDAFDAILAAHYEARIWKASVAGEESTYANDVRALIDELDSVKDPHASFTELYSRGVYLLHYDDKEAARAFDTSITNVSRYRRGGGAPAAAKIILRHLRTLLENAMGDE